MLFKLPKDDWKDVLGYEGLYKVNCQGQVCRVGGDVLKPYQGQVYLSKRGKVTTVRVANIVAQTFLDDYQPGMHVFHIQGDSDALSNLSLSPIQTNCDLEWRDIPGYEGAYQATKTGRIRSLTRSVRCRSNGTITRPGRELLQTVNLNGYATVPLSVEGKSKICSVHRLVALTYLPNPENKPQVNHIDGNKLNNDVTNLEWVTQSENIQHAKAQGLWNPEKCGDISRMQSGIAVRCITDGKEFGSISQAAKHYGMDFESVRESAALHKLRKGFQFEFMENI